MRMHMVLSRLASQANVQTALRSISFRGDLLSGETHHSTGSNERLSRDSFPLVLVSYDGGPAFRRVLRCSGAPRWSVFRTSEPLVFVASDDAADTSLPPGICPPGFVFKRSVSPISGMWTSTCVPCSEGTYSAQAPSSAEAACEACPPAHLCHTATQRPLPLSAQWMGLAAWNQRLPLTIGQALQTLDNTNTVYLCKPKRET